MRRHRPALLALVAVGLFTYACASDTVTAPSSPLQPTVPSNTLLSVPLKVNLLLRTVPLLTSASVTADVGPNGATLSIPKAGLTVVVPPNAVKKATITVTANAGMTVTYDFQPHGLVFNAPITITQDLSRTTAVLGLLGSPTLLGAYYRSATQIDLLSAKATVNEIFDTKYNAVARTVSFQTNHFSGYLVATGFDQE